MPARPGPVPLLIVSGALGAGKTTFINELLQRQRDRRLAAIVNDFGSVNIDAAILVQAGQPIFGMENGCICCTLQGDLIRTLRNIISLDSSPEGIIVEASGLADPRGILIALRDPFLAKVVSVEAILTVVDAGHRDLQDPLWQAQISAADHIYFSKTGGSSPSGAVASAVPGLAGKQVFYESDLPDLANGMFFTDVRKPAGRGIFFADEPREQGRIVPLEWRSDTPISLPRFQALIEDLGPILFRAKGLLRIAGPPEQRLLFQLAGQRAVLSPLDHDVDGAALILFGEAGRFDEADVRRRLAELST